MTFSNEEFKLLAINIPFNDYSRIHSPGESFFILIHKIDKEDLSNLCQYINNYLKELDSSTSITLEDCYNMTQNLNLKEEEKNIIYSLAKKCLQDGLPLGTKVINNNINTSDWIGHSIYVAEVCKILAKFSNLDNKCAESIGLLHDYGRKFDHSFNHTIKGFEELINLGLYSEAIGCLTHSFLNGGRCSNNEPALEGFYVDNNGNPRWKKNAYKDDLTLFLENYRYSPYDYLLNIADLTATGKGIVAPHIRIKDIATRRVIDKTNRGYFLCDLINTLIKILNKTNQNTENYQFIKATSDIDIKHIEDYLIQVSKVFYNTFFSKNFENENKKNTLS